MALLCQSLKFQTYISSAESEKENLKGYAYCTYYNKNYTRAERAACHYRRLRSNRAAAADQCAGQRNYRANANACACFR